MDDLTSLQVHNFPPELRRTAKSLAAQRGETLKDLVIRAIEREIERCRREADG